VAAIILVRRVRGSFAVARKLVIVVDGKRAGTIRPGQDTSIEVTPGVHTVTVRMDWARTGPLQVTCAAGTTTNLDAIPAGFVMGIVYSFVRPSRLFSLKRRST
jgi:hypothetical protein